MSDIFNYIDQHALTWANINSPGHIILLGAIGSIIAAGAIFVSRFFGQAVGLSICLVRKFGATDRFFLFVAERNFKINVFWRRSTPAMKFKFVVTRVVLAISIYVSLSTFETYTLIFRIMEVNDKKTIELINASRANTGPNVISIESIDYFGTGLAIIAVHFAALTSLLVYFSTLMWKLKWAEQGAAIGIVNEINNLRKNLGKPLITGNEDRFYPDR